MVFFSLSTRPTRHLTNPNLKCDGAEWNCSSEYNVSDMASALLDSMVYCVGFRPCCLYIDWYRSRRYVNTQPLLSELRIRITYHGRPAPRPRAADDDDAPEVKIGYLLIMGMGQGSLFARD